MEQKQKVGPEQNLRPNPPYLLETNFIWIIRMFIVMLDRLKRDIM